MAGFQCVSGVAVGRAVFVLGEPCGDGFRQTWLVVDL
jgi:hypothetical protein